jgi:hypothetical protein
MTDKPTYAGHEISAEELERLRTIIEGLDTIGEDVSDDMRNLIERWLPDLAGKLPPKSDPTDEKEGS